MKHYIKHFIKRQEGIETIEVLGLLIVAMIFVALIVGFATSMVYHAQDTQSTMEDTFEVLDQVANE